MGSPSTTPDTPYSEGIDASRPDPKTQTNDWIARDPTGSHHMRSANDVAPSPAQYFQGTGLPLGEPQGSESSSSFGIALRIAPDGDHHNGLVHAIAADIVLIKSDIGTHVRDRLEIFLGNFIPASVLWVGEGYLLCKLDVWNLSQDTAWLARETPIYHEADATEDMLAFGKRLQSLRNGRGLKQLDIAERLGVSTAAVSQWEKGRKLPRGTRWLELADCLGVGLSELTGHSIPDLQRLIGESRTHIARAAGINPQRVKISLEM